MLRLIYILGGFLSLISGVWMLFFPFSWYSDFPAAIPDTGPFNSHLIRDLGVAYLCIALAFVWCAGRPKGSRQIHLGLTVFFTGHAIIHLFEIFSGRMPRYHWMVDTPLVFLPAIILIVLSLPRVRERIGG